MYNSPLPKQQPLLSPDCRWHRVRIMWQSGRVEMFFFFFFFWQHLGDSTGTQDIQTSCNCTSENGLKQQRMLCPAPIFLANIMFSYVAILHCCNTFLHCAVFLQIVLRLIVSCCIVSYCVKSHHAVLNSIELGTFTRVKLWSETLCNPQWLELDQLSSPPPVLPKVLLQFVFVSPPFFSQLSSSLPPVLPQSVSISPLVFLQSSSSPLPVLPKFLVQFFSVSLPVLPQFSPSLPPVLLQSFSSPSRVLPQSSTTHPPALLSLFAPQLKRSSNPQQPCSSMQITLIAQTHWRLLFF